MKRRILIPLLAVEAALCLVLNLAQVQLAGYFSSILAFPFEQLAWVLQKLSCLGSAGNGAAFALWAGISLIPLFCFLRVKRKGEDTLLALLCPMLAIALWLMANPAKLAGCFMMPSADFLPMERALLGGVVWCMVISWALLRFLRNAQNGSTAQLWRGLGLLLALVAVVFVYSSFGAGIKVLLADFAALRAANTGVTSGLWLSEANLVLRWCADLLSCLLTLWIILQARQLLQAVQQNAYDEAVPDLAHRLGRNCARALRIVILVNLALNLCQLLFAKVLRSVNALVQLPVFSVCFVLAVLLLARLVEENRRLKLDNDSII